MAASLVVAARDNGFTGKQQREIVRVAAGSYQSAMATFATMSELDVWYSRADIDDVKRAARASTSKQRRSTLDNDRRALLDRFEYVDMARKVVGVGSVGTRCWIVLLRGRGAA